MILPPNPAYWPQPWRDAFEERASIMADSDVPDAELKAESDIRLVASIGDNGNLFGNIRG